MNRPRIPFARFAPLLAFALALVCAAAPWSGRAARAAGPSAFGEPVVVVYPLTIAGANVKNEAGSDVAILLATKIAQAGDVTVKPPTAGTARADYLAAALKLGADYYVTGFLQPLGGEVSMIAQVVSTHSGSVVFSTTATIRTYADAAAQADPLHEAILRHAGRGLAALDAPPPEPSASAASAASAAGNGGVNLTKALRKKSRATPAPAASATGDAGLVPVAKLGGTASASATNAPAAKPSPSPSPAPAVTPAPAPARSASPAPARSAPPVQSVALAAKPVVLAVDADGAETPELRTYAATALVNALRGAGTNAAQLEVSVSDTRKHPADICAANSGTKGYYLPFLVLGHDERGIARAQLSVDLVDCSGAVRGHDSEIAAATARGGDRSAIDLAAARIVARLGTVR